MRPGMFLELDLGEPAAVDQVEVSTSWDCEGAALKIEIQGDSNIWTEVAGTWDKQNLEAPTDIRRQATQQ